MPALGTREQALAYLAVMSPTEEFHVQPFTDGWVATAVLSPEQMSSGAAVGLCRLVIDSDTGTVYLYPSWPTTRVAEAHTAFNQTGVRTGGAADLPHQWRITVQRDGEDDQTIVYQLTAESLTDPPGSTRRHQLTVAKRKHAWDPRDPLSHREADWKHDTRNEPGTIEWN